MNVVSISERGSSPNGPRTRPQLRDQRVRRELAGRGPGRHAGRGVGGGGRAHGAAHAHHGARAVAHRGHAVLDATHAGAAEWRLAGIQGMQKYLWDIRIHKRYHTQMERLT